MQKSEHYVFMDALVRRIHEDDEEALLFQEEFYRLQAGLAGEMKLKTTLADYFFKSDYEILYNFECINLRGFTHQIDALLITPHFIIIFEVKQISGSLFYKPAVQEFYRVTDNGIEENFANPFDQVYRHQLFIEQFLQQSALKLPVLHIVVIANYRAKLDNGFESMPIIHLSSLPKFLESLYEHYPSTTVVPRQISELFKSIHQRLPARRQIEASRLKTGVFCHHCNVIGPMLFYRGFWHCEHCKTKSTDGIIDALQHYRILIGPHITNHAFRNFLGIKSRYAAIRLLSKLNVEAVGQGKSRYYVIPEDLLYGD
ncbi:NERD domain-containing protein [Solibacillus sp. MA9]|uniref:NERD domain-containing protein n=1 Tax=Solibacillus palustris TaxID=2908203 RepID=A0ABS9U8I0_9BACL|nr:nuclease-related domain-containing protein [Solibacillus sp. MA9]MCH7320639.1 NERD domain-containing protein [Solibacillus sp. MA9]